MKKYSLLLVLLYCSSLVMTLSAQESIVTVNVDPTCQRFIGGVSKLNRDKYFNIHNSTNDDEMIGFMNQYNVNKGRMFSSPFGVAKRKTGKVGSYPKIKSATNKKAIKVVQNVATAHPKTVFFDGIDVNKAAKWAVDYYSNQSELPAFYEPINEPFVHAKDFYEGGWNTEKQKLIKGQMAALYGAIGKKVHKTPALKNMQVIGYSAAWPSLELKDFDHWNTGMKMFMDTAGEHMDAFATHLYDGINVEGQNNIRSGSNTEAILDLIETYSFTKWNTIKPHAITEYGAIEKGYPEGYSDVKSIQTVRSINHILFSLLEREDRLAISIPFITGKAIWHINEKNNYESYGAVLWRPLSIEKTTNINRPILSDWKYTARIHFYELWKEVVGNRIDIQSSNPDIQVHAFLDGKKLYVALNNLDDNEQKIGLHFKENFLEEAKVTSKGLRIYDREDPIFENKAYKKAPSEITLIPHETVILTYKFNKKIEFSKKLKTLNVYTKTHLQSIKVNKPISFQFNEVPVGINGRAIVRMGISRKHDKSKKPIVEVNGKNVVVPDNWKGYDQAVRDDFFGVIDIPFSAELLLEDTTVSVTFPDNGGRVSSLILTTELYK